MTPTATMTRSDSPRKTNIGLKIAETMNQTGDLRKLKARWKMEKCALAGRTLTMTGTAKSKRYFRIEESCMMSVVAKVGRGKWFSRVRITRVLSSKGGG